MNHKLTIDVCIATYKRPNGLKNLLVSLAGQKLTGLNMRVIVVDNDSAASARSVAETFKTNSTFDVIYDIEPRQGISYARNRAIQNVKSEYFAFIDDDEIAEPNWLMELFNAMNKSNVDVVFGKVQSILPGNAPKWAKSHPCFVRPILVTGKVVTTGYTSNVLIHAAALGTPPQLFDPAYGLTGGGDTEFFYRLSKLGGKLIQGNEGIVNEPVPNQRLTIGWVCRRGFRSGQTNARIYMKEYSLPRKLYWLMLKITQILGGILITPIYLILSFPAFVRLLTYICGACGQLSTLFGKNTYFKEYESSPSMNQSIDHKSDRTT